jgi:hypothetical protein
VILLYFFKFAAPQFIQYTAGGAAAEKLKCVWTVATISFDVISASLFLLNKTLENHHKLLHVINLCTDVVKYVLLSCFYDSSRVPVSILYETIFLRKAICQ